MPVWINVCVHIVWGIHVKGFPLLPSRLQMTQYLWLLVVDAISNGIDFGLNACPLSWNCSLGVSETLSIHTSSSTLSFLYNLELHEFHVTSLSHTFPPINFTTWSLNLIPGGIWRLEHSWHLFDARTMLLLLRHMNRNHKWILKVNLYLQLRILDQSLLLFQVVYFGDTTYCDTGHPFTMVIPGDPWHTHLFPSV